MKETNLKSKVAETKSFRKLFFKRKIEVLLSNLIEICEYGKYARIL